MQMESFGRENKKQKRCLDTSCADVECQPDRKIPALANVIVEALKVDSLQKLCSSIEPVLRRVVSEEVERALAKLCPNKFGGRSSTKYMIGPDGRNLQLHFRTQLSRPLFTGGKVEGEQGEAIQVVLIDANTGRAVTSGPQSSVKLDIVVLQGDFNNENDDNWTQEEFESHLVKEREGKRPLLSGDLQVTLTEGIGTIGDLAFTDNSSWIRSRKFRLGLKVASGYCEGVRIREAKSEAFTVKDHRGELYKKHYPPTLHDEVWRLEKIGKDGSFHKRLNKAGVYTVEDFLRLMVIDSQRLRNILGSGMSNKMWDVLVEHSKTCTLSGKLYVYYPDDAKNLGVVFNSIYEFIGLLANAEYSSTDSLSENQMGYVDTLVKKAYENWMHVVEYSGTSQADSKQNAGSSASQAEVQFGVQDSVNSYDHRVCLSGLPNSVTSEHPSGYGDNMTGAYSMHSQNINLGGQIQYDGTSFPSLNTTSSAPMQATVPKVNEMVGICQHSSTPVFEAGGTSNPISYRAKQNFTEEEIRTKSHEILENNEMQHLLRIFNMGGYNHASINVPQDGNSYSSNNVPFASQDYSFDDDPSRSLGKGVVGWLKLKAALRWGIFVRKKAAERDEHCLWNWKMHENKLPCKIIYGAKINNVISSCLTSKAKKILPVIV